MGCCSFSAGPRDYHYIPVLFCQKQELSDALYRKIGRWAVRSVSDPHSRHPRRPCRGNPRSGILHNEAFFRRDLQHLRRRQKHLGIGFGSGYIVSVRYGVKAVSQLCALQNNPGVFAGGSHRKQEPLLAQLVKRCKNIRRNVAWPHFPYVRPVYLIFLLCHRHFFRFGEGRTVVSLQKYLQTVHTAHAAETVVNLLIKKDIFLIRDWLPCKVMKAIRKNKNAVQIKYKGPFHSLVSHFPQNGSTGLLPSKALLPVSLSIRLSRTVSLEL